MDISNIKELWQPNLRNLKAGIEWWNSKAEKFSVKELPTAENSIAMRIIQRENMVCKGSRTLNVGCGGGRFIAVDGIIHEISNTTIVAMYWHVN